MEDITLNKYPNNHLDDKIVPERLKEGSIKKVTPLHLAILIHHFTSETSPFSHFPATREYTQELVEAKILEPILGALDNLYRVTSRGKVWMEMLKSTPLPARVDSWTDPRS